MDDEWVDVPPSPVNNKASRRGDLDPTLRAMGLSDADLSALDALDAKQPNAATNLSMLGGLLGPVGAGAGAAAGTLLEGGSAKDAATSGAINWAIPAGMEKAIGALRQPVANLLRRGAVRSMKAAVKPDRGYLEKMAGSKRGGIAKMETEIAETALDEGVNPVRRSGMDKLQGKIEGVAAERTGRINAAPDVPVAKSGRRAMAGGRLTRRVMARGDAPQDDMAVVDKFINDLTTSPRTAAGGKMRDLTPKELAETVEAGNDRLRGLFSGQSKNAEVQARLNVQRARTRSLDEAANTGELSNKMRKLIDLRNVGNIATRRAESNNPISLTDVISFSAGRPAVAAGSIGMKAPVLADIAGALNRAGKSVGTPSERAEALRRILVAYLANQGGDK